MFPSPLSPQPSPATWGSRYCIRPTSFEKDWMVPLSLLCPFQELGTVSTVSETLIAMIQNNPL